MSQNICSAARCRSVNLGHVVVDQEANGGYGFGARKHEFSTGGLGAALDRTTKRHAFTSTSLRYTISCDVSIVQPRLALENAQSTRITLDGSDVPSIPTGYYVDESISTVTLPDLSAGVHTLILSLPYDKHAQMEACFLLGDFGASVRGTDVRLSAPIRALAFGDWTQQGLPFYGGHVTYHCVVPPMHHDAVQLHIPKFRAPLIGVSVEGVRQVPIALPPYQAQILLKRGSPTSLDLTATAVGSTHLVRCTMPMRRPPGLVLWRSAPAARHGVTSISLSLGASSLHLV